MATVVLVHGAWHGAWCWSPVVPLLRAQGHVVFAPTLTGLGERAHLASPLVNLETHIEDVVALLRYEQLTDVVLVGHSYAGQVITSVADRAPAHVRRLIYLDAFLPEDGDSAMDLLPEPVAEEFKVAATEQGLGWLIPPPPLEVLGVKDPADEAFLSSRLNFHPLRTYLDPVRLSGAGQQVPGAFVECTEWIRAFGPFRERAAERGWPVSELRTSHEAMVTAPQAVADTLDGLIA